MYPYIVEHEMKTYPNTKHVRQRLCAMNPPQAFTVKFGIEMFLKVGFIYLVPLIDVYPTPFLLIRRKGVFVYVPTLET